MRNQFIALLLLLIAPACRQPERRTGGLLLPDPDSLKEFPLAASAPPRVQLPPAVDMEPNLPPAGDQGDQGSCVSWALGYNLVSYYEKSYAGLADYGIVNGAPDPRKVYSAGFIYNYLKQRVVPTECIRGIFFRDAFNTISRMGNCQWADFPYNPAANGCVGGVPTSSIESASRHKGYRFQRISKTVYDIKVNLYSGFPVIIGVFTSEGFYEQGKNADKRKAFIWNPSRNDRAEYHAMLIVGYDSRHFKLMNSWGRDWGNSGYVWIPYDRLLERTVETYTAEKSVPERGIASTDIYNLDYTAMKRINANKSILLNLPNTAEVSFENFSMKMRRPDTSGGEVMLGIEDSSSRGNSFHGRLKQGEIKQFYISDSLITLQSEIVKNRKKPIQVQLKIDSGAVDQNILEMDSMLQDSYQYLKDKKEMTSKEKSLMKEFTRWESGYTVEETAEKSSPLTDRWYVWLGILLTISFAGMMVWFRKRTRK